MASEDWRRYAQRTRNDIQTRQALHSLGRGAPLRNGGIGAGGIHVDGGTIDITNLGALEIHGGGGIDIHDGGDIVIHDGGTMDLLGGGALRVTGGGRIQMWDSSDTLAFEVDSQTGRVFATGTFRSVTAANGGRASLSGDVWGGYPGVVIDTGGYGQNAAGIYGSGERIVLHSRRTSPSISDNSFVSLDRDWARIGTVRYSYITIGRRGGDGLGLADIQLHVPDGGRVLVDGDLHVYGETTSTSTERNKHDLQPIPGDWAPRLLDVTPVTWDAGGKRSPGLTAEDMVAAGLDAYVGFTEDGEPEGLLYDRAWTLLIPLVRDLYDRVNALEGTT